MRRALISLTCAVSIAAIAAGCGGDSGNSGPAFSDSISTADADTFALYVGGYATYVASAINFGGPSILISAPAEYAKIMARPEMAALATYGGYRAATPVFPTGLRFGAIKGAAPQLAAAEGCTYSGHGATDIGGAGDPVDVNQNGIPDDYAFRIECVTTDSTTHGDTVVTTDDITENTIRENFASLYGGTIQIHFANKVTDNFGNVFIDQDVRVGGTQDIRSDHITDQSSITVRLAQKTPLVDRTQTAGESWNNGFTPAIPIALGDNIPDGALTVAGNRYHTDTDSLLRTNITFGIDTPTPMAYSAACAAADTTPPFTAGELRGRLNNSAGGAEFLVTFTSCGNFTIDVSGTRDPSVVAARR